MIINSQGPSYKVPGTAARDNRGAREGMVACIGEAEDNRGAKEGQVGLYRRGRGQ